MVSVVIPTHNRVDLLPRAIKSVQSQTISDVEIIVVSDGSTDDTDTLMTKIAKEDSRITYISYHPGHNGNYARNQGIKAAKGEFVAFLDDDDEWCPSKLEEQLKVMMSDEKIGLVYTGTQNIFVEENLSYARCPKVQGNLSKRILLNNVIGSTTTVMVRKAILDKTTLFDESLRAIQDYDLWVRICQLALVGVVSKPLVKYYNYRTTNQISANFSKYEQAFSQVNQKYEDLIREKLSTKELNKKYAMQKLSLAMIALRNNNGKEARNYYIESLNKSFGFSALLQYVLSFLGYHTLLKLWGSVH